ncbi:MAG: hypothetical protein FWG88_01350 [Oscillospiraceae bacterium]|nr:hypothetical protein [Oscillospiraceae bacterium]
MKKSFVIFMLLLVLSLGGMCYGHISLSDAQYNVSFTMVEEVGDVKAADGLSVSVDAHLDYHLFWETMHKFGDPPQTHTEFTFFYTEYQSMIESPQGPIFLTINSNVSTHSPIGIELNDDNVDFGHVSMEFEGLHDLIRDVASRTKNGENYTETHKYTDYTNYYRISTHMRFGGYYEKYDGEMQHISNLSNSRMNKKFSDFFMLEAEDAQKIIVTIGKDSAGNVVEVNYSLETDVFLHTSSFEAENGIYLAISRESAFNNDSGNNDFMICFIPISYFIGENNNEYKILEYDNISKVFPNDKIKDEYESKIVRDLSISEDGLCINLIALEDNSCYLTVIDIATMTLLQKLLLYEDAGDTYVLDPVYTGGLLYVALGDGRFILLEEEADNTYHLVLEGERNYLLSFENYLNIDTPIIAWNGEQLALVSSYRRIILYNKSYYSGAASCGFVIEVYDNSGLLYKGAYASSLDVLTSQYNSYNKTCRLVGDYSGGGLAASW